MSPPEILSFPPHRSLSLFFPSLQLPFLVSCSSSITSTNHLPPHPTPTELPFPETSFILREVKWPLLLWGQSLSKASLTISVLVPPSYFIQGSKSYPYLLYYYQLFPEMITCKSGGKYPAGEFLSLSLSLSLSVSPQIRYGAVNGFDFYFFIFINLFYLFIFVCVGSSLLCVGFL